ncbi:UDP-glucose 4-epimerase GalE [Ligilactobacillus ceti]|uniref:UDP-glucose 4-epimerase n=1 Tax=Ligilactobacillus ceti DSM 22408 TaxID=1122146 RepID=A0A0R2KGK9_9LACO|nr:UDP-glucose 4-epimerase GalE [Ligilactobacillus ceti]KRN88411.1 UDP-glucose 4-epimerase [Ligilactobacillus ceti DSM 22408]
MAILVVGGAGYIGSHMVDYLISQQQEVIVVDNLSTGHQAAISKEARFYQGDLADQPFMRRVFKENPTITAVIHFAAYSLVGESMQNPLKYFDNNTSGLIKLLEVMHEFSIRKIIFSSTAAVYGIPKVLPITEKAATEPINPYGESKLMMEKIMFWAQKAYGIEYVAFRYFNVAGAKPDGSLGEDHHPETHLVPLVLQVALGQRKELALYGDDYQTADGTNVRDYVHPFDLAQAHLLAVEYLQAGNQSTVFNLGSATGFSNLEIIKTAQKVTGQEIPYVVAPRRPGDPDSLVANARKARDVLGWEPEFDNLETIIATAWNWHQKHPNGY